jgi:hypothetical protein
MLRETFEREGYAVVEGVVGAGVMRELQGLAEPLLSDGVGPRPGVRRVFEREPRFVNVLRGTGVPDLLRDVGGEGARVIRTILFDKSPGSNWAVAWHQDAVVALRERHEVEGFAPWSVKDGEPHARPPLGVLDQLAVLRISLDDCGPDNGPVRVIPRSHRLGRLASARLDEVVAAGTGVECCTRAGGALLMRPHTIHASSRSTRPARRRVLHIEFTSVELPGPLRWAEAVRL